MKEKFPHATHPATAVTHVAAAAATVAPSATAERAAPATKRRGCPRKARPYRIAGRSGWWANPRLPDGARPLRKFESEAQAAQWIANAYESSAKAHQPALGGPDVATVAQALYKYAFQFTVVKGGVEAELTRINNYLQGGGLPTLRRVVDAEGRRKLEQVQPRAQAQSRPSGRTCHAPARIGAWSEHRLAGGNAVRIRRFRKPSMRSAAGSVARPWGASCRPLAAVA